MNIKLETLRKQLNNAKVSDDMISRGVRVTSRGIEVLARKLKVTTDEVHTMLSALSKQVRDEVAPRGLPSSPAVTENAGERFEYEADFMGNVTLRDTKTGASRYLQGSEGAKFLHEIELSHPEVQSVIAPFFNADLLEFAQNDIATGDSSETGGTYNFPFQGNFAVARFWLAGAKPQVEVVSVLDANGEEMPLDDATKAAAQASAWEWVNKV